MKKSRLCKLLWINTYFFELILLFLQYEYAEKNHFYRQSNLRNI